jgi:acyl-CoA dehydrogenase
MSILYDEAQQAIAREAARVLEARADRKRALALLEQTGDFDHAFWSTAVEQGWTGLALPEAVGGLGLGLVELGIVAQAAGAAIAGAPFLTTNDGAAQGLLAGADAGLKERWLPKLAAGEAIGTVAFAEGSEPLPEIAATRFEGGALTGAKPSVVAGLQADFAIVWASHDGRPALAFAEISGVDRLAVQSFDNSRGYANLAFSGAPATLLLEGAAARAAARKILARMAVVCAHEQVGGAEAMMLTARDYANTRKAFGQPIGAFQSIKHRIAELYARVEVARANCLTAASHEGEPGFLAAAASARLCATEAYDTAAREGVQIHGGVGVTWEGGLHLHMRRARSLAGELGAAFFWEDLLVGELTGASA